MQPRPLKCSEPLLLLTQQSNQQMHCLRICSPRSDLCCYHLLRGGVHLSCLRVVHSMAGTQHRGLQLVHPPVQVTATHNHHTVPLQSEARMEGHQILAEAL